MHAAGARCDRYCRVSSTLTDSISPNCSRRYDGLARSTARWYLLANQVPFAPNDTNADPTIRTFGGEKWDSYPADRQAVLDLIDARNLTNTVVITGDVHQNFVRNVPPDYERRRPHAQHRLRRQRQQPAPALLRQPSWLRPVHGGG